MATHRRQEVEGWFSKSDAQFYKHQARRVTGPARFVEIGSWKGRSSCCIAEEIRRLGKPVELWCVDTWRGSEEHSETESVARGTLYDEFLENVKEFGDFLQPLRLPSADAAGKFEDASLDFVFIDAGHDYQSVKADIGVWRPKVKPGGVLAGHDYSGAWPGVVQAVDESFGEKARFYGACWYVSEEEGVAPPSLLYAWKRGYRGIRRRMGLAPFRPRTA